MQRMKNTETNGTDSLDDGVVSATSSMNTVVANINVIANDRRSPKTAIQQQYSRKYMNTIWSCVANNTSDHFVAENRLEYPIVLQTI